jgi:hypothetical protein
VRSMLLHLVKRNPYLTSAQKSGVQGAKSPCRGLGNPAWGAGNPQKPSLFFYSPPQAASYEWMSDLIC